MTEACESSRLSRVVVESVVGVKQARARGREVVRREGIGVHTSKKWEGTGVHTSKKWEGIGVHTSKKWQNINNKTRESTQRHALGPGDLILMPTTHQGHSPSASV
jgi:hypothetical protein